MPPRSVPELLGIREAATCLGVSIPTLRRWDRAGKLTASRHPMTGVRVYARAAVEALASRVSAVVDAASPASDGTFVGRAVELRRVLAVLREGARVVTLIGPGGIGKTTLARRTKDDLSRGGVRVAWCALANATEASVVAAIAAGVGAELPGGLAQDAQLELVARRLARSGASVLVIDNAEHVLATVAKIVRTLRMRAPRTSFVVTSRRRLGLRDEVRLDLGPLAPADAVALLVQVAATAGAHVDARRDAEVLAKIARRLDGIPLALEIAGARLATHAPADVLAMVRAQLDLGSRKRDVEARHATLRATIAWSYDMLAPRERDLFERLSVFRGGFDARAVVAITGERGASDAFDALRDGSLVHAVPSSEAPRFDLYEAVRELAAERLAARPQAERDAHERHAVWLEALASAALEAPPTDVLVASLGPERDNLLAALGPDRDARGDRGLLLAIAADHAAGATLPIGERERLLDVAIGRGAGRGADRGLLARAYATRGRLRVERSETAVGVRDLEHALALAKRSRSALVEEYVAGLLAVALLMRGSLPAIRRALARAERVAALPVRPGRSLTLAHIATVKHELGDLEAAARWYARGIALASADAQTVLAARLRARLGRVYVDAGRLEDAEDALSGALPALAGDRLEAWTRAHVALLRWRQGRLDDAREGYVHTIELFAARGATSFESVHHAMLAAVLAALARGVDATAELERARADAKRVKEPGLDVAIRVAEAHRALLDARRAGAGQGAVVRAAHKSAAALAPRDKEVRALLSRLDAMSRMDLPTRACLVVASDGAWMTPPDGARAELPAGSPLRAVLRALASRPGESFSGEALIAAAWPEERILPHAATRRLHAAVSDLRARGLGDRLERTAVGYRLAPSLAIRVEPSG